MQCCNKKDAISHQKLFKNTGQYPVIPCTYSAISYSCSQITPAYLSAYNIYQLTINILKTHSHILIQQFNILSFQSNICSQLINTQQRIPTSISWDFYVLIYQLQNSLIVSSISGQFISFAFLKSIQAPLLSPILVLVIPRV